MIPIIILIKNFAVETLLYNTSKTWFKHTEIDFTLKNQMC